MARFKADTIYIAPGEHYDVIWTALKSGKWLIHCHDGHHTTNNNVETQGGGGPMVVIEVTCAPTGRPGIERSTLRVGRASVSRHQG